MSAPVPAPADEAALAQRAAAGDGEAFGELYERYEKRAYNLCLRIVGSDDDAADATQEAFLSVLRRLPQLEGRELAFGSYLFTSARNACYDQIQRRKRAEPSDEIAAGATPVGSATGGGGIGFDPGDPEDDPERNVLLDARTEEIRAANAALPERQREVLALRELEDMSYDEIAAIMDMNRNSVAQLISRARINLRDSLRGTALASIATTSADCERALPLIAARDDGQLDADGADGRWLASHLRSCETCALSLEAMAEAGVSYRAWVPVAATPLLLRETLARAAELTGSDWSDAIARAEQARSDRAGRGNAGRHGRRGAGRATGRRLAALLPHRRLALALATAATLLLLLVVLVGSIGDGEPPTLLAPAADEAAVTDVEPAPDEPRTGQAQRMRSSKDAQPGGTPPADEQATSDEETVAANDAAGPVGDQPASAQPRARRRAKTVAGADKPRSGDRLQGEQQATAPAPTPTTPEPPAQTTPDTPPVTTPEPPPPPPTGCVDARGNPIPCPPPQPPRVCRDPATGAQIPCSRVP